MKSALSVYLAFYTSLTIAAVYTPVNTPSELTQEGLLILENIRTELGGFAKQTLQREEERMVEREASEGERRVEYLKAQVKAKLAKNRDKIQNLGKGKERIEAQLKENRIQVSQQKNLSQEERFYRRVQQKLQRFSNLEKERLEQWNAEMAKKRASFIKNIPQVKQQLIEVPADFVLPKKYIVEKILVTEKEELVPVLVPFAFEIPIRNQLSRPTCSAFAGVRAMEILLRQNAKQEDLSEHYFYFASKPACQKFPCEKKGSWVGKGLAYARKGVPLERDCPYQGETVRGNQTQIPLTKSCQNSYTRVQEFSYLKTDGQALEAIKQGKPVVASFRLSENFYSTKGVVSLKAAKKSQRTHSGGHAVLLVGAIPMPLEWQNEGKYCFLAANSWGEGWGVAGHACLTESWIKQHRNGNPYVVVNALAD